MELDLAGKHIFISGAAGGIGLKLVEEYLNFGCKVTAQWHSSKGTLEGLLKDEKFAGRLCEVQAELTNEEEVRNAYEKSIKTLGPMNVLVVNHAIYYSEDIPVMDMDYGQWKKTLDVNLNGAFLISREFLRQAREHKDQLQLLNIVFISSTAALFGEAFHADYSTSKSALQGFALSLKNEIVKIKSTARVNLIAPGWVRTPMAEASIANGDHLKAMQTTALCKIANTEDVCRMVVVISSDRVSGHISGATIPIHGGMEGRVLNKF